MRYEVVPIVIVISFAKGCRKPLGETKFPCTGTSSVRLLIV